MSPKQQPLGEREPLELEERRTSDLDLLGDARQLSPQGVRRTPPCSLVRGVHKWVPHLCPAQQPSSLRASEGVCGKEPSSVVG